MVERGIKLFLLRHCQDLASQRGRFEDSKLTLQGENQAQQMAEKLNTYDLGSSPINIYSSPMIRATQTASFISAHFGTTVQKNDFLADRNTGQASGLSYKEVQTKFASLLRQSSFGIDFKFPDGESNGDVFERSLKFVNQVLQTSRGTQETIIVISHPLTLNYITYLVQGRNFTDSLLYQFEPGVGAYLKKDQSKYFQLVEFSKFY